MWSRHPKELGETHLALMALLRQAERPLTAYDLLAALQVGRPRIAPPTIYRALKRLIELGCVHRLESLNAYTACSGEGHSTSAVFTICGSCGEVAEHIDKHVVERLRRLGAATGFIAERPVIELHGTCGGCRDARAAERLPA